MVTSGATWEGQWDGTRLEAGNQSIYSLTKPLLRVCGSKKERESLVVRGKDLAYFAMNNTLFFCANF